MSIHMIAARRLCNLIVSVVVLIFLSLNAYSENKSIILQSTTSTANSGLYRYLLPIFKKQTGINVNVVAVGTGQAIRNAENGDGDVLLVHAKPDEEKFVKEGFGVKRYDVMYNDFIIIGPPSDPAKITGLKSITKVLKKIAETKSVFVSRGDNSGTHKKEVELWKQTKVDPLIYSGRWYRETGTGMGATLNIAVGMNAYTLSDRGTWISFKNKQKHKILFQGDDNLFNQYGVILINPKKHQNVKSKEGQEFIDWIIGDKGQRAISKYKVKNQQLFFPNAKPST